MSQLLQPTGNLRADMCCHLFSLIEALWRAEIKAFYQSLFSQIQAKPSVIFYHIMAANPGVNCAELCCAGACKCFWICDKLPRALVVMKLMPHFLGVACVGGL